MNAGQLYQILSTFQEECEIELHKVTEKLSKYQPELFDLQNYREELESLAEAFGEALETVEEIEAARIEEEIDPEYERVSYREITKDLLSAIFRFESKFLSLGFSSKTFKQTLEHIQNEIESSLEKD